MQNNFGGLAPLTPEEFRAQLLSAQEKTVTPAAGGDNHGSHNATTAEGASAYEEFLSNCRALNLKANTALLQRAEDIRSGSTVDLSRTYVGGAGLQAACTLLAQNRALRHLRLPQNGLYNDAVVYFCRSMKRHPTLETVDFSGNPQISLAGGLALLSLVHDNHPTLIELNVTGTRIPDAVLAKIQRALTANQEARMLLSSDDGSLVPSPLPHSPATTGMAKTLGAPYSPPSRTAAGHAAVKADGTTVFSNTYTAGRDPTNRKAVFTADHTGLSSSSAVVAASATATGYLRSATLSTQHNGSSRPTTSHLHDSAKPKSGPTASTAVLTQSGVPTARTREQREAARAEAWATREEQSLKRLQQQMEQYAALLRENNAINTLPPAEPTTRWRVLEVAILAPPAIFDSEIALLVNDVFPALNAELQSRRVALQPLVNPPPSHTTPATAATISGSTTTTTAEGAETAGQALRALQCVSAADVLPDVQRPRLLVKPFARCSASRPRTYCQTCSARAWQ